MSNTKTYKNKMSKITNPLIAGMATAGNTAFTANGAVSNASTLDACVDFYGAGGAIRNRSDADIISLFSKAFYQDRLVALKTLFYFRDVREGQGERKVSRAILRWLADNYTDILVKNIDNIPFFGRWDDLYALVGTKAENAAFEVFAKQLRQDSQNALEGKEISLLAKWLKSINTSSKESRRLGFKTASALGLTPAQYRKCLSALRKHLDVLEIKLSGKNYSQINYEAVPSKASLQYRKAFGRNDGERYRAYLGKVEKGEAKINANTLYPYEIIRPIELAYENDPTTLKTLDLQWKNQPDWLKDHPHKGIVVADTSGSMSGLPILVSVSLAIYFAERNEGPFKDTFITFSQNPTLQLISGQTIAEKVRGLNRHGWDQNTNLQAVFDLILSTALKNKLSEDHMPDSIYIISDMQFDIAGCRGTNFDLIKRKFESAGYKVPKLIFWNVNAVNKDYPVTVNDDGVCLVSGCSPSILKSVLSAKSFTPTDVMLETINNERYDRVKV
jgi:hypothetical protein